MRRLGQALRDYIHGCANFATTTENKQHAFARLRFESHCLIAHESLTFALDGQGTVRLES